MRSYCLILITLIISTTETRSQDHAKFPVGKFYKDSVMIGEEVEYSLSYSYSIDDKIIFPDSSYNYFPFEFSKKEYFPTKKLDSETLLDSVVYTLATFELDSVYYIRIPVFILEGEDSIIYYSNSDSLIFKSVVSEIPEPAELKSNTDFEQVNTQFNYIYFFIVAGIVIILLVVLTIIFGKKVYQNIVIFRLRKKYAKFEKEYQRHLEKINTDNSKELISHLLNIWKGYMERLDRLPLTKSTTKEISFLYQNTELKNSLKEIDRKLYGNIQSDNMKLSFGNLKDFSLERLNKKIQDVKHG